MDLLSVIIPAFNEERRIAGTIRAIGSTLAREGLPHEIIVIDDGSTDRTGEVSRACAGGLPAVAVAGFPRNRGKGAAVAEGVLLSKGGVILFVDADLALGLDALLACARSVAAGSEIVIGSKHCHGSVAEEPPPRLRRLASGGFRGLVRLLLRLPVTDSQCGLKAFRRGTAERLFALRTVNGFAFDVELLVIARRNGIPIKEVPVRWRYHSGSGARLFGPGLRAVADLALIWIRDLTGAYRLPA